MKLGLAGHREDPRGRTLKLRDFLRRDFAVPVACDLEVDAGLPHDSDPLGNLAVGCCAVAAPGHFARWEDKVRGQPEQVQERDVLGEYATLSGWTEDDPDSDTGLYALDVFKHWRTVGLFGRKIEAFAQVDFLDPVEMQAATFLLGGVFLCLSLPRAAMESDDWDLWDDDGGRAGGHMVYLYGCNCNSWGIAKRTTPAFVHRYAFDAFAAVSSASVAPGGRAFSGLDIGGLRDALAFVTL
jgi:hypothetical protein